MRIFSSFGFAEKLFFAKHLATLLKGGIPLAEALKLLSEQGGKIGPVAGEILSSVENGQSLSASLGRHPDEFGAFYISLVEVGEVSGTLEKSLEFLAEKLAREEALRKKVQTMLFYPSIVLAVSAVVGGFVSFFVLPKLAGIFSSFDVELPIATRILLTFANFVKVYGVAVIVAIVAAMSILGGIIKISYAAKLFWHHLKFHIPFVGKVNKSAALSSLFRDLGVMLQSGLPLEYALRVESEVAENLVIREKIKGVHEAVSGGSTVGKELASGEYEIFPTLVSRMISVGESSGTLEGTFLYLADFFEDETDAEAKNGAALLEPLLLVFIALVAGFVALAVILPIYTLTGSIHR
ncbi:MAG: Type IV fimbrial assembly protein PilC [Candidatus Moranbacteria bacterium GW2011_GWA2_39_41]|nr:MAG: Type IV fimbrial assembly protein PilC [Candidatus Moranbacteria bacterium GW2011_GWA2_39_41]